MRFVPCLVTRLCLAIPLLVFHVRPASAISTHVLAAPTGEAADDKFGGAVTNAGDLNGDDYSDIAVGAFWNDATGTDAGRVYVFFGGPSLDATPDLVLSGQAAGDWFGTSVDGAGDINGDGAADLIVGARYHDTAGTDAGRAYVFFGGVTMDATPDLILDGAAAGDQFGSTVSGAGDVNGDGKSDVIVGAPDNDAAGSGAGRAYVYFGAATPDAVPDITLTGEAAGDYFGAAVDGAGDVNGDGKSDVIVGAMWNDHGGASFDAGRAYIYYGGATPDNIADLTLSGEAQLDNFGHAVAGAGDFNGDGWSDVIVGANWHSSVAYAAGRAYVFHGGPGANAVADFVVGSPFQDDHFGWSVGSAGDINLDGYGDVIVGAIGYDDVGTDEGLAAVYFGGAPANTGADLGIAGAASFDQLGVSVAGGARLDDDGRVDLVIGADGNNPGVAPGKASFIAVYPYQLQSPNGGETWIASGAATVTWRGADLATLSISYDGGANWTTLATNVGGAASNTYGLLAPSTTSSNAKVRLHYFGQAASVENSDQSLNAFSIVNAPEFADHFSDAFPANPSFKINFPGPAYDTTAAHVKTSWNTAQLGGTQRPNIPGDTTTVRAPEVGVRMDLVFRILPGVGNYVTIGNRTSGLRKVPTATTAAAANAASANLWESYLANNGAFGTGGDGTSGPGHPGGTWDPNRWNSARMDTAEINLFPASSFHPNLPQIDPAVFASMYHESDPKYGTLGIVKNRCFIVDPTTGRPTTCASKTTTSPTVCNVICGTHPVSPTYPPLWTSDFTAGMSPSEGGVLPQGQTREFTKIIPDGQLTPGAHVEYFFRKSMVSSPLTPLSLVPDTSRVVPQPGEGTHLDGHRWAAFSVLPDRWKDLAFGYGTGMATMLVVDWADGSGEERAWVAVADTIFLTQPPRRGAHTGWKAAGNQNVYDVDVGADETICVRPHLGQPGSVWDLYQVRGGIALNAANHIGSRYARQPTVGELIEGRENKTGPEDAGLRNYRQMLVLMGDLGAGTLGEAPELTDPDLSVWTDFLVITSGSPLPRGLHIIGTNLMESQISSAAYGNQPGSLWAEQFLRTRLRNGSYRTFNTNAIANLIAVPPISPTEAIYGVSNGAGVSNDVMEVVAAAPAGQAGAYYENVGSAGPYVASVYAPEQLGRPWRTLVEGWRIGGTMGGRYDLSRAGFLTYWYHLVQSLYSAIIGVSPGPPVGIGDAPASGAEAYVNSIALRSANPMRSGEARIVFGLARPERAAIRVYDVTGRKVRTLADRRFEAGQSHTVLWDGTSESGERVGSGVYFYRIETPTWRSEKKITVLTR